MRAARRGVAVRAPGPARRAARCCCRATAARARSSRDLRAWPALHARLALVEASDGAPAAARIERSGAVFWVSGRRDAPPTGSRARRRRLRYLVDPGAAGGSRPWTSRWPAASRSASAAGGR